MRREVVYYKPNMASLHGRLGRQIMAVIRSTPSPDFSKMDQAIKELEERILLAKRNGIF